MIESAVIGDRLAGSASCDQSRIHPSLAWACIALLEPVNPGVLRREAQEREGHCANETTFTAVVTGSQCSLHWLARALRLYRLQSTRQPSLFSTYTILSIGESTRRHSSILLILQYQISRCAAFAVAGHGVKRLTWQHLRQETCSSISQTSMPGSQTRMRR